MLLFCICRQDCINILSRCLDSSRLTPGQTAEKLCGQLSAESSAPCISLSTYMGKGLTFLTYPSYIEIGKYYLIDVDYFCLAYYYCIQVIDR